MDEDDVHATAGAATEGLECRRQIGHQGDMKKLSADGNESNLDKAWALVDACEAQASSPCRSPRDQIDYQY